MIRLGSNSITRAKILRQYNIDFIQSPSNFNEDLITTKEPLKFVKKAVIGKYKDLIKKYSLDIPILVADSVVECNNILLRKAKDINEARYMLNLQSNNKTSVITAMIFKSKNSFLYDISKATYLFDEFDKKDLENYLKSNIWQGKAGAITIEYFCKPYIKKVKGLESTAMGLTIEKILPLIINA